MITHEAVEAALRAFDARTGVPVLDLVEDSDLDRLRVPRRLRFRRDDLVADVLVHDSGGPSGLHVALRLTPLSRFTVRAATRGRGLTVESTVGSRSDARGIARLRDLPHGITSLQVEGRQGRSRVRTAWVRM